MAGLTSTDGDAFVWRQGRVEVSLKREANIWLIRQLSAGRLLGPNQQIYEERHKQAKYAAWDVMARVIRVSQDEDEGLLAGREAAKWIRSTGITEQTDD